MHIMFRDRPCLIKRYKDFELIYRCFFYLNIFGSVSARDTNRKKALFLYIDEHLIVYMCTGKGKVRHKVT